MTIRSRSRSRRRGFTLMEVLLVLAILVILGSLVTVSFFRLKQGADKDAARSQISLLEDTVNAYTLNIGTCPTTQQGLNALVNQPSDLKNPAKWAGPYLEKQIPQDPWGNEYQYEATAADQFRIWSIGPDQQTGTEDDIANVQ